MTIKLKAATSDLVIYPEMGPGLLAHIAASSRLFQFMTTTLIAAILASTSATDENLKTLDAISFHDQPGVLYVRLRQVAVAFDSALVRGAGQWHFANMPVQPEKTRKLYDGTQLIRLGALRHHNFMMNWDPTKKRATLKAANRPGKAVYVRRGDQRVVVNKSHLMLVAWQGESVVFRSQVGIGRLGYESPNGNFKVQNYRAKMHYSSLYNNTPMPWAVQIVGNVFIHGSPQARGRSSHGCIRLATSGRNPAKWFYMWAERGTPVAIQGHWPAGSKP